MSVHSAETDRLVDALRETAHALDAAATTLETAADGLENVHRLRAREIREIAYRLARCALRVRQTIQGHAPPPAATSDPIPTFLTKEPT